jgi:hypothetical protein
MIETRIYTRLSQDRINHINDSVGAIVCFACRPFGVNVDARDLSLVSVEDFGAKMTRFEYRAYGRRLLTVDHESGWVDISLIRPNGKGIKFIHIARIAV